MNIVDQIALRASAERPALIEGCETVTYGQLMEEVSRTAAWLRQHIEFRSGGIPRIGLACPSGKEYIVLALAILKTGGCLVPVAGELTAVERDTLIAQTCLQGLLLGSEDAWNDQDVAAKDPNTGAAWLALKNSTFGSARAPPAAAREWC
jgi:long-chain acyl-CoA synthetase